MTRRFWTMLVVVGAVALGAGVGVGAAIWAGGDHEDDATATMASDGGMESMEALDEQAFLEMMVPHHRSAVEMATLALEKAKRPEIRTLARAIIAEQEGEIAQMESWHLAWFGEELVAAADSEHGMGHGAMDIGELESVTGDEFDRAFLSMMIPHHASAIAMAESVMMGSPREEVMMLAEAIVASQAAEIGQMQTWRNQWFPRG